MFRNLGCADPAARRPQLAHPAGLSAVLREASPHDHKQDGFWGRGPPKVRRGTAPHAAPGLHQHPVPRVRVADGDSERHAH